MSFFYFVFIAAFKETWVVNAVKNQVSVVEFY